MDHHESITKYLGDLAAVSRHCAEAIERQLGASFINDDPIARETLQHAHGVLLSQINQLEHRLTQMQASGKWKQALTSVTGFLAGVYDTVRTERLSRALRDNYTALGFVHICQTMMLTTALACDDVITSEMMREHLRELPPLLMRIAERVPSAVVRDLDADMVPISNRAAADAAVLASRDAWHGSPTVSAY